VGMMGPDMPDAYSCLCIYRAYDAITGVLSGFFVLVIFLTFGSLGVASNTESFKRLAPRTPILTAGSSLPSS
jgi:hypothetical protein